MVMIRATRNGDIPFTPEEEAERTAEIQTFLAERGANRPAELKKEAYSKYLQVREAGTTVNGLLVSADQLSVADLIGGKVGGKPQRKIATKAGGKADLSQAQFDAVVTAVDAFVQACQDRLYDIYLAVDSAVNEADLDAIDINAGWPA